MGESVGEEMKYLMIAFMGLAMVGCSDTVGPGNFWEKQCQTVCGKNLHYWSKDGTEWTCHCKAGSK